MNKFCIQELPLYYAANMLVSTAFFDCVFRVENLIYGIFFVGMTPYMVVARQSITITYQAAARECLGALPITAFGV